MKNCILFIISLTFGFSAASCGYYPYGEDVRFNLLKPKFLKIQNMDNFHYSFDMFSYLNYSYDEQFLASNDENTQMWYDYFEGIIPKEAIYEAVYGSSVDDLKNTSHHNIFIKTLNTPQHTAVLEYLIFAKKCSYLNASYSDPWERTTDTHSKKRKKQIKAALKRAAKSQNSELKQRYAYLALRLAFYNSDKLKLNEIYNLYFKNNANFAAVKPLNALDYWALHFKIQFGDSSPRRNIEAALVFSHSKEKRFAVHYRYDYKFDYSQTMQAAKNDDERAAASLLHATRKTNRALQQIKDYHQYAPKGPELEFLILREVNKLEDWVLTPYYSLFEPSISGTPFRVSEEIDDNYLEQRITDDRKYAAECVAWMNTVDNTSIAHIAWWTTMKQYLRFIADDMKGLLQEVSTNRGKQSSDKELKNFNNLLYSLVFIHAQKYPNLVNETLQNTLLRETDKHNNRFLFAIARELEYKGKLTDAAYVFSNMNKEFKSEDEEEYGYSGFGSLYTWKFKPFQKTIPGSFFQTYFYYLNVQYSADQIAELIHQTENATIQTEFDKWKFGIIKQDLSGLYDLLGTKYMRTNDLESALQAFENVTDQKNEYINHLDANPFYTNLYNEHTKTVGDTIVYSKPEMIRKLIEYTSKIENTNGKTKAYYCFQVANCYLNMSFYGNSWMMRRYFNTSNGNRTNLPDDEEYFQCDLAKKYYLVAKEATSDQKIIALSLRMAGRCEKYRLYADTERDWSEDFDAVEAKIFNENKYYSQLKKECPDHYEPLISNCHSFKTYYNSLRSN